MTKQMKMMSYKTVKWSVFILIIGTAVSYAFLKGIYFFFMFAVLYFFGPRLESSMERVYCGREIACHNIRRSDITSGCLIIAEIIAMIYENFIK